MFNSIRQFLKDNNCYDETLDCAVNVPIKLLYKWIDETQIEEVIQKAFYENGYGASPTVCPECKVDDFCHTEGCSYIGNELDIVIAQAIRKILKRK